MKLKRRTDGIFGSSMTKKKQCSRRLLPYFRICAQAKNPVDMMGETPTLCSALFTLCSLLALSKVSVLFKIIISISKLAIYFHGIAMYGRNIYKEPFEVQ
jgi:hypothetical protein